MTADVERGVHGGESGAVLWLIPAALVLHNGEEAVTIPHYLAIVRTRLPPFAADFAARISVEQVWVALAMATIIPVLVIGWTALRPRSVAARWSALVLQMVIAVNVVSHLGAAVLVVRGYSPGLVTALLVNAPLSVLIFRRAMRGGWVPAWSWWLLLPAAILVHGPGLVGLLLLA